MSTMEPQLPFDQTEASASAEPAVVDQEPVAIEPEGPRRWFLSAEELTATKVKLAKINKRAEKRGFTGRVDLTVECSATRSYSPAEGAPEVTVHGFEVTISGKAPTYDGWRFVAAVDKAGSPDESQPAGVVLRYPPGVEQTINNADVRAGECDHCHKTRPRSTTFLLRHDETDELKQVGRSCLRDFLGSSTTPVFIDVHQVGEEIDKALGGSRTDADWDLESVLTYAAAVVAEYGWTPATGAMPTRTLVAAAIRGRREGEPVLRAITPHLEQARHTARQILDELPPALNGESGYEANLTAILRSGRVNSRKHLGLAVSAVKAWERLNEKKLAEQVAAEKRPPVTHAGAIGDTITLCGTVTTATRVAGFHYRAPDRALLVIDCGTTIAKTITSAGWAYDLERGDQVTLSGVVKAHDTYKGVPQTVLSRPKKINEPEPAPPATWETVQPITPRSRFQEAPLAAAAPLARGMTI
jgi:hypothetical protein